MWKTTVMQGPTIIYLYFLHLKPVRIFQSCLWGWTLILAEFTFLSLWHCHKEHIQMSWSRDWSAGPASIWKMICGRGVKLSTTNLPISPRFTWYHIILFDWNVRIYGLYRRMWAKPTELKYLNSLHVTIIVSKFWGISFLYFLLFLFFLINWYEFISDYKVILNAINLIFSSHSMSWIYINLV